MRLRVFEFEDFDWFPDVLRRGMMDYLRYFFTWSRYYAPVAPLLQELLVHCRTRHIVDLCAGGGGPSVALQDEIAKRFGPVTLSLTDLYPNRDSCQFHQASAAGTVRCIDEPVDAISVPDYLPGVRTIFSSIHHFEPEQVGEILKDAAQKRQGIALFDIGDKNILIILAMMVFHPLLIWLLTPFFRPFRWSTILFTYLIPLIPLFTVWDGVMSILRLYNPDDLSAIAKKIQPGAYTWESGKLRNSLGFHITYLVGSPTKTN